MFTMAKIRNGGTYLARHLAASDYYSEREKVVGVWTGQGAEQLGLKTPILPGDTAFENLRNNRHPDGSQKLTPRDGADRIRFFDFQCSAQKSVSIMAVTMGDDRLLAAHDDAARLAFAELEKFAGRQANTVFQRATVRTGNVVAAVFRHTASRALDPQLHSHFVTANATWDAGSNSWRALTEFEMLSAIRYAGKVYQNELARSCLRLGYDLERIQDSRGMVTGFEIAGVGAAVRERFSKRRAEVEQGIGEFRRQHGRAPSAVEIHAITVASRNAKLAEITTPEVLAAQRAQLAPVEQEGLAALKARAVARCAAGVELPRCEYRSLSAAVWHLFERRSVASGHEVLAEALNQNLGGCDLARLHAAARESDLVGLTDEDWLHGQFATRRGLELEQWAVGFVDRTREKFSPLGGRRFELGAHLSPEQRSVAETVLGSRDQVVCLRGAAGVGKTTVLREIHRALRESGAPVYCFTPTSSAADTLRRDGVNATTVSDFLQNVVPRESGRLAGAVLICDEAGLTSNEQGAELLQVAERHSARVVFLGDSRQHSSVEAGDFLRVLESHSQMHRIELTAIRRQQNKAYRHAVRWLAAGAPRGGLERLDRLGWLKEGGPGYLKAAAEEFFQLSEQGRKLDRVLAVTPTWAEHEVFTAELRTLLKTQGALGAGETITVHDPLKWTKAQARTARNYALGMAVTFNRATRGFRRGESFAVVKIADHCVWVQSAKGVESLPLRSGAFSVSRLKLLEIAPGDRLLVRANDRGARVFNGEVVSVARIDSGVIRTTDGRRIDTRQFRALTHGFAVTSHAAQSKTVEHVVVAARQLTAKSAYVACSRGKVSCALHTPDKATLLERLPAGHRAAALDLLPNPLREGGTLDRRGVWTRWANERAQGYVDAAWKKAARVSGKGERYGVAFTPWLALARSHAHDLCTQPAKAPSPRLGP
ncbi:MAG: relaxase domain-containing protein [Pirellulales bacterium]|nr:relaxase domain-containing protein [Pirellulales bacterium]